jgi:hypothetical protein
MYLKKSIKKMKMLILLVYVVYVYQIQADSSKYDQSALSSIYTTVTQKEFVVYMIDSAQSARKKISFENV